MRGGLLPCLAVAVLLAGYGCRDRAGRGETTDLAARAARLDAARTADSSSRDEPLARWVMPKNLAEISGLALSPDGRLFTHPDEHGVVSQVDYRRGITIKQFVLGRRKGVQADFEGIAITPEAMYLLTSNGRLYQFKEGANGENVEYTMQDLELGKECEFEGLAYDSTLNALLLACKNVGIKELKDHLVIYRYRLGDGGGERLSRLDVPVSQIQEQHDWKDIGPTGIDVDPQTGNYVLLTMEKALIIMTREGTILEVRRLPPAHDQPEGIAITRDSLLIISDEAVTRPATVTVYRWP